MQEEMEKGEPLPEMRVQMATKMKRMSEMMRRMSEMMRRMSGWADLPTMKEPEMRKQYEEMRRQMDEMTKSHSTSNPGRLK